MKCSIVLFLLVAGTSNAFVTRQTGFQAKKVNLRMSSKETDIEALKAAAAKAREEANRLAEELGKPRDTFQSSAVQTKKLSEAEIQHQLKRISFDSNGVNDQTEVLETLRTDGCLTLYKSANLRTYPVSLNMLESRTQISLETFGFGQSSGERVSLDDFKYSTLFVLGGSAISGVLSLALLPPNIGATVCYALALVPILYLAIGSTAPAAIAQVIDSIKNKEDKDQITEKDRVARHEAAHFMCGYMCGLPIVNYNILSSGVPCVAFSAGAEQRFGKEAVAALSITAMSGLVSEAMTFGDVRGAENDLMELDNIFRRAEDFIGAQQQQDLTRWGVLQAFLLLKENRGKLDQLVEAFKDQKNVAECVAILES